MPQNAPGCPTQKNRLNYAPLLILAFTLSSHCVAQPAQVDARAQELLGKLTPEEKIDMISGVNGFDEWVWSS